MKILTKIALLPLLALTGCGTGSNSKLDIIGGQQEPSDKLAMGSYPSTLGISGKGLGTASCTASRLSQNTFITAAHCLNNSKVGEEIAVYASNSRRFTAFLKKIRIHPTWIAPTGGGVGEGSDVALFELSYALRDEKVVFDGLVKTIPIAFGVFPKKDLPVIVAGFGCEQKQGFGGTAVCEKSPGFKYMKSAQNKVYKEPLSLLNNLQREFELDASTQKEGITGFTSSGDSGGPALTLDGKLLGVTRSSDPLWYTKDDAWFGTTSYTWLDYPDVKDWLIRALDGESKTETYQDADRVEVQFLNGDRYVGSIRNGFRTGKGAMFHRDGKEYNGDWLMNAKSGYGEQTWPAGSKYSSYHGAWANGLPNGTGIMIYPSGMVYTGQFVDAKLQGDGQMKYANGDVRTGKFINDKREGEFILVTVDGLRYREQYSGDVRTSIEEIK